LLKYLFNPKIDPYNKAAKLFGQLRNLDDQGQEYWNILLEGVLLCCEAIKLNKYDGDAHVMLANFYLLAAFIAIPRHPEGYVFNISRCSALMYEWKHNKRMHSKFTEQGDKIYGEIVQRLKEPNPEWLNIELTRDMSKLHEDFYKKAIRKDHPSNPM
jgi:hypothetical protein